MRGRIIDEIVIPGEAELMYLARYVDILVLGMLG
jgi:hypothetical protein